MLHVDAEAMLSITNTIALGNRSALFSWDWRFSTPSSERRMQKTYIVADVQGL